ncbi:uncharacterized protein LY89DRAFT_612685, partial [Mollisia scopiformis]
MAFFFICLLFSNILTFIISTRFSVGSCQPLQDSKTLFAKLERDVPVPFEENTPFTDSNQTLATQLWEDINIDAGMVALPDDLVELHGLREAQRFPWDDSRSIYLLNGYHNLHCIRAIYLSLQEFYRGDEQSRSWGHVLHCADAIRQDILCNADDTPRYSTESKRPESGVGQMRMCRSWDKLDEWAEKYNSCYAYVNQTSEDLPEIQRFVYCPAGSPWREKVVEVF